MRQIAVYGKGGIGKSMISSHISFAFAAAGRFPAVFLGVFFFSALVVGADRGGGAGFAPTGTSSGSLPSISASRRDCPSLLKKTAPRGGSVMVSEQG